MTSHAETARLAVPPGTVVVAVDGSKGGDQALAWAVRQAAIEHRPLTIAHTSHMTMGGDSMWMGHRGVDLGGLLSLVQEAGRELVDRACHRALQDHPDLVVHRHLSTSVDARSMLLDLSEQAAMLVVGSRGRGPIASVLLGSVSATVVKHAACAVVVVRLGPGALPRGGIVVAADDSEESRRAIELAYQLASYRALPLTALRVVRHHAHVADDADVVTDEDRSVDDERLWLSEATAGMREKFPDVRDHQKLVRGLPEHELVRASRGAELLVLGWHRQSVVDDVVFGSVAQVVERAGCDVVIVHEGVTSAP